MPDTATGVAVPAPPSLLQVAPLTEFLTNATLSLAVGALYGVSRVRQTVPPQLANKSYVQFIRDNKALVFPKAREYAAKSAAFVSLFCGTDLLLRHYRQKDVASNKLIAGATTGAVFGATKGPVGAIAGCVIGGCLGGFAGFTTSIVRNRLIPGQMESSWTFNYKLHYPPRTEHEELVESLSPGLVHSSLRVTLPEGASVPPSQNTDS